MLATVPREPSNDTVRAYYQRLAPSYDWSLRLSERLLKIEPARRWLASNASGNVLEIGVGTGLNLPFYGPDVRLTGVDLSSAMLALARARAGEIGRDVDLQEADAQGLEFPDAQFDSVVFSLCLCSIPDDRRAVAEGIRVLKPGGRMLLLEHVRSPTWIVRAGQRLIEPLVMRFQADHLTREPLEHLRANAMVIEEVRRWGWGIMERVSARKPTLRHRSS
jgi:ubiquinone/menaquinone biosynthesis C-methylase UbiE